MYLHYAYLTFNVLLDFHSFDNSIWSRLGTDETNSLEEGRYKLIPVDLDVDDELGHCGCVKAS